MQFLQKKYKEFKAQREKSSNNLQQQQAEDTEE